MGEGLPGVSQGCSLDLFFRGGSGGGVRLFFRAGERTEELMMEPWVAGPLGETWVRDTLVGVKSPSLGVTSPASRSLLTDRFL